MQGLMMNSPLTVTAWMQFAQQVHSQSAIVSVMADKQRHRYCYSDCFARAGQLANALASLGLKPGDRVGTLAWNDYRHLELYCGISASGYVCHTINPKLSPEHIIHIINQADDQVIFVDPIIVPLLVQIQPSLSGVKTFVLLSDKVPDNCMLRDVYNYEALLAEQTASIEWPELDENTAAALCYTSGTTGRPKGVLYSHRSMVLHSYAGALPDAFALSIDQVVMPVVPMFHVHAWGIPYGVLMSGATLILPGPHMLDAVVLTELIQQESVTVAAAVPTIWHALLDYLDTHQQKVESLQRVFVGGSACPLSVMERLDHYGVYTHAAWGMTETSPLGAVNRYCDRQVIGEQAFAKRRTKAGYPIFGIEMAIVDDKGCPLPHDGMAIGCLKVRGPWVARAYYSHDNDDAFDDHGWFDTGDMATIAADGLIDIVDRVKDMIRSGGEWISSVELEHTVMEHPEVQEVAAIAVADQKWTERPLLIIVKKPDSALQREQLYVWLEEQLTSDNHWWLPDNDDQHYQFVERLPYTATGKVDKKQLREQYNLPNDQS